MFVCVCVCEDPLKANARFKHVVVSLHGTNVCALVCLCV